MVRDSQTARWTHTQPQTGQRVDARLHRRQARVVPALGVGLRSKRDDILARLTAPRRILWKMLLDWISDREVEADFIARKSSRRGSPTTCKGATPNVSTPPPRCTLGWLPG